MFALSRHIPQAHVSTMAGGWERKTYVGNELYNKKLGVVGLGKIGSHVARVAKAMGMEVLAYDPFISTSAPSSCRCSCWRFKPLFAEADYISLHLPPHPRYRASGGWCVAPVDETHRPSGQLRQGRHRR